MGTTERIARSYGYREQVARTTSWGHRFLFFNILLTCLIGTAYVYAAPDTGSFSAFCYLIITWIGQMSFLAFIIYLVILFPLSFIGKFRLYRWLAGGVATACHAVLLFDAKLFLTVKVHLSLTSLGLILRDLDFKTGLNYNFLYLAIPLIIALEVLIARYSTRSLYRHGHSLPYRIAVVVFILSFVSSHLIHIWADASRYERIQILRPVFPAHFPMTARSFLESHGWLNESLSDRADAADAVTYPLTHATGEVMNRNLLIITLNGLSYADLTLEDTPQLMALKQQYHSYEQCYLPYQAVRDNAFAATWGVPVSYRDSFAAAGLYPVTVEEMHHQDFAIHLVTDDLSIVSRQDLQHFLGSTRLSELDRVTSTADAVKAGQDWLKTLPAGRPFALSLSVNPLNRINLSADARRALLKETDSAVGAFIDTLRGSAFMDHTLIIITSLAGNPDRRESGTLYPREQQHVPLIVIWPEGYQRSVSSGELCSTFDLVPTVGSEILGLSSNPADYSVGNSLFNLQERQFFVTTAERSLLLIAPRSITVYRRDGRSFIENYGVHMAVEPNLRNLMLAMRMLNRFKQ